MLHTPFDVAKECTRCDECNGRLVIPPGVEYRGMKLHRHCYVKMMKGDRDTEQKAPFLDEIEHQLQDIIDVGEGTI